MLDVLEVKQGCQLSFSSVLMSYIRTLGLNSIYKVDKLVGKTSIDLCEINYAKKFVKISYSTRNLEDFASNISRKTAQLLLGSVATTYKYGKKHNLIPTYTGRDGVAFYLASALLGRRCYYIPGWSSETNLHRVDKTINWNPVFLDTGFRGSLFTKLASFRTAVTAPNVVYYPFFLMDADRDWSVEKRKQHVARDAANAGYTAALALERLNHPVYSGNPAGEFLFIHRYPEKAIIILTELAQLWNLMTGVVRSSNIWR